MQRVFFCRQLGHQTGKEVKGEDSPAFKKHPPASFEFGMVMHVKNMFSIGTLVTHALIHVVMSQKGELINAILLCNQAMTHLTMHKDSSDLW